MVAPRKGWIRSERKGSWEQYVGRRVRRMDVDGRRFYIAWAGRAWAGEHEVLAAAQEAVEQVRQ